MSTARALFGLAAGFALPTVVVATRGGLLAFLDLGALLLAPGVGLAVTLGLHGSRRTLGALRAGLRGAADPPATQAHVATLLLLRQTLLGGALAGLLLGLVGVMANLQDPTRLGPAVAVSLLGVLYGGTLAELVVAPLARRLHAQAGHALVSKLPSPPYAFVAMSGAAVLATAAVLLVAVLDPSDQTPAEDAEYVRLNEGLAAGHMFTLRGFTVKMWAEEGPREASFSLALQAREGEGDALEALLAARSPIVRESILLLALDTTAKELAGSGGLETFQSRIKRELLVVLEPEGLGLEAVYLTDLNLSTD